MWSLQIYFVVNTHTHTFQRRNHTMVYITNWNKCYVKYKQSKWVKLKMKTHKHIIRTVVTAKEATTAKTITSMVNKSDDINDDPTESACIKIQPLTLMWRKMHIYATHRARESERDRHMYLSPGAIICTKTKIQSLIFQYHKRGRARERRKRVRTTVCVSVHCTMYVLVVMRATYASISLCRS